MNKELFELLKSLEGYQCYIQGGSLHLTGHIEGLVKIKVMRNFIEFWQRLEWNHSKVADNLDSFLRTCEHLDTKGQYHEDKFSFITKVKEYIKNVEVKLGDFYPFNCKSYQVFYRENKISSISIVCEDNSIIKITQLKTQI